MRLRALRLLASFVILLFATGILWGALPVFATPEASVLVDGRSIAAGVPPFIENGRTLVPVRALAESLGAKVIWEEKEKTITIEAEGKKVKLQIGNRLASSDGRTTVMEVAPRIVQGRAFVPLRFVSEHLGAAVKWDAQKSQARVYKKSLRPLRLGIQKDKFTLMNSLVRPWYDSANFFVVTHTPLVIYTPDMDLAPGLAESWEISPDGKSVTFLIRGNAMWSDGKPVTVEDVKFSYEYGRKHKLYAQGTFLDAFLDRVETVDEGKLKVVFKEPVATLFLKGTAASLNIIPEHVWSKVEDPRTYDGPDAMVGCGPFVFERYDPATQTAFLKANEDYFAGKPLVPAIQWRYFETLDALLLALQKGEIDAQMDYVNNPGGAYADALKRTKGLVVEEIPALGVRPLLYFGFRQYPTNLREFREAVSLAIDYQLLLNAICAGYGELPGRGFTPPGIPGYDPTLPRHRRDPEQAKRILEAAGFVDRDGDGLRETLQGEKLRIPVTTQAGFAELVRAAEIVSLNLKSIGLDAFVEALEPTVASDKAYRARDYHLLVWRISPYGVLAYSPGGYADFTDASGLYGTCKDPELLRIIEEIEHARTPADQEQAVRRLQAFIARELPAIALVWRKEIVPHSDRWTGWVPMVGYHVCNYWTWFNLEPAIK